MKRLSTLLTLILLTLTASAQQQLPATPKTPGIDVNTQVVPKYIVSYYMGDALYAQTELRVGQPVTPPAVPDRDGYIFSGWSEMPETMPAHDVVVNGAFKRHLDVGHLVKLLNFIMNGNATADDQTLFDINEDGELNIGDVILVVKNILESDDKEAEKK